MSYKIVIGLPVYNEEKGLPYLFEKIDMVKKRIKKPLQVVAVNDGSTDNTEAVLRKLISEYDYVTYINHDGNKGLGEGMNTLFNYAIDNYQDGDILVTLDSDNTHNPNIIPNMVSMLRKEKKDVVVASRFVAGGQELGLAYSRKVLSRGAKLFFKMFFPIPNVNDYSCGYRAYNVSYLKNAMELYQGQLITSRGFECMAEIMARFSKIGVEAAEYPLVLEYNLKEGQSKMKITRTIMGYFSLLCKVDKPHLSA